MECQFVHQLPDNILWLSPVLNFRESPIMVCGVHLISQFVAFYGLGFVMD